MALYKVIIPYGEGSGSSPRPNGPKSYTTVEIEADSESGAKDLALTEFREMAALTRPGAEPRVDADGIRVERAPVARVARLEVTSSQVSPGVVAARLVGSISAANFHEFQQHLDRIQSEGARRLVLDLSGLTYVNSTGLSLFIAAGDVFDLRLASVPGRITRLFRMIGLDKLFPTYETAAEAAREPSSRGP